jgi:hypothetical protein
LWKIERFSTALLSSSKIWVQGEGVQLIFCFLAGCGIHLRQGQL